MIWKWTLGIQVLAAVVFASFAIFVLSRVSIVLNLIFGAGKKSSKIKSLYRDVRDWTIIAFFAGLAFILADFVVWLGPYAREGYSWIVQTFGLQATHLLLAAAVVMFGVSAFVFKSNYQRVYGIVEVGFAFVAAIVSARQIKPEGDWSGPVATLIGCVYIVSRGLGNMEDGRKAEQARKKEAEKTVAAEPASSVGGR